MHSTSYSAAAEEPQSFMPGLQTGLAQAMSLMLIINWSLVKREMLPSWWLRRSCQWGTCGAAALLAPQRWSCSVPFHSPTQAAAASLYLRLLEVHEQSPVTQSSQVTTSSVETP